MTIASTPSVPLVSVIVRTKDRPALLEEALASVVSQRYRPIELVVVNDGGEDVAAQVEAAGTRLDGVRYVRNEYSGGRAAAANAGLEAASGEWLIFLDDDDWFEADHLSALVTARGGEERVIYSGARYVEKRGDEGRVMSAPFELQRLMWGNYIPIHAVLFHRSLVDAGCRFDERFEVYEDWDFWLQLAEHTPFRHVDKISAGYRAGGTSGADPATELERVREARGRVYDKWRAVWDGGRINAVLEWGVERPVFRQAEIHVAEARERAEAVQREAETQIDAHRRHIRALDEQIEQQRKTIGEQGEALAERGRRIDELSAEREALAAERTVLEQRLHALTVEHNAVIQDRQRFAEELHGVLTSTSWRITFPMRWIGFQVHRLRLVKRVVSKLRREPSRIAPTVGRMRDAWHQGGFPLVKKVLRQILDEPDRNQASNSWYESFGEDDRQWMRDRAEAMENPPLISVLMPTYNTPAVWLREAIDSVRDQLYPHWQLCIADDGSKERHVRKLLKSYAAKDKRIKVSFSDHNTNISAATNRALAMAEGAFVALMDHDDLLEPQALFRVAESIVADEPDMIYSDEALVSESGGDFVNYVFRPQFSLELLRAHPYIVHLAAFRTELLRELGGLDESMTISQDYDLMLRFSERARRIVHIPEILYRWRQHTSSTGHQLDHKVMDASRAVIERHLERCGETATVEDGARFNFFQVRYPLGPGARVAIVIPTKNHGELVRQCVESIERTVAGVDYDIVVVDHASDDPASLAYFEELKEQHIVLPAEGPFNFSTINNGAIARLPEGRYSHYLLCNNDIEAVEEEWLERMVEFAQKPDVGIVGAHLLYPDQLTIQHAGVCVGMFGAAEHYGKFMRYKLPDGDREPGYLGALVADHEMTAVTAACMLVRSDAFEAVGGLDEALAVGFGDVDFCLRVRESGYRVVFSPNVILIHHESYSRGKSTEDPHPEDSALFRSRWSAFLAVGDPYYNPNLTIRNTFWHLREPWNFQREIVRRVVSGGCGGDN